MKQEDARALKLAKDILELQRQIDALPSPIERIEDRNSLRALMSQQACAAPKMAEWVNTRLTKKRRKARSR